MVVHSSPREFSVGKEIKQDQLRYLFFDVETTGLLPENYRFGFNNETWPRIVQAAWILADEEGKIIKTANKVVAVDVPIPPEVSEIHGITNEIAQAQGIPLLNVLEELLEDLKQTNFLICHNVNFDLNVLRGEVHRSNIAGDQYRFKTFCTMLSSMKFCGIYCWAGLKWPSLTELYDECFRKKLRKAHDAFADVKAVHKIFFHLKKIEVFEISEEHTFFRTLAIHQPKKGGRA